MLTCLCGCFIVSLVCVFKCCFVLGDSILSFVYLPLFQDLLVRQVWGQQTASTFAYLKNILFLLFLGSLDWLDIKFVVKGIFSLRMLNIGPKSLQACRVSAYRSAISLIGFPL